MPYAISVIILTGLMWPLSFHNVAWTPTQILGEESLVVTQRLPRIPQKYAIPVKKAQVTEPLVDAASAIVVDNASGTILWQKNPDAIRPIASLTKVTTVLTFLEYDVPWEAYRALTPEENVLPGAKLREDAGERMTITDLFLAVLVGSTNNGALSLAHATGDTEEQFVARMNALVQRLGLTRTHFVEPTGLSSQNVSTVSELWRIFRFARTNSLIVRGLSQKEHLFETVDNKRFHRIRTTNELFDRSVDVVLSKTGYTDEAEYTLGSIVRTPAGQELTIIVLGAPSIHSRTEDTVNLLSWANAAYDWGENL